MGGGGGGGGRRFGGVDYDGQVKHFLSTRASISALAKRGYGAGAGRFGGVGGGIGVVVARAARDGDATRGRRRVRSGRGIPMVWKLNSSSVDLLPWTDRVNLGVVGMPEGCPMGYLTFGLEQIVKALLQHLLIRGRG